MSDGVIVGCESAEELNVLFLGEGVPAQWLVHEVDLGLLPDQDYPQLANPMFEMGYALLHLSVLLPQHLSSQQLVPKQLPHLSMLLQ